MRRGLNQPEWLEELLQDSLGLNPVDSESQSGKVIDPEELTPMESVANNTFAREPSRAIRRGLIQPEWLEEHLKHSLGLKLVDSESKSGKIIDPEKESQRPPLRKAADLRVKGRQSAAGVARTELEIGAAVTAAQLSAIMKSPGQLVLFCSKSALSNGDVERIVSSLRLRTAPVKEFHVEFESSVGLSKVSEAMATRAELFREVEEVTLSCYKGNGHRCEFIQASDVARIFSVVAQSAALKAIRVWGYKYTTRLHCDDEAEWEAAAGELGKLVEAMGRRAPRLKTLDLWHCMVSESQKSPGLRAVAHAVRMAGRRLAKMGRNVKIQLDDDLQMLHFPSLLVLSAAGYHLGV